MRVSGVNALTAAFVVGVLAGLLLTPDGRAWLRKPTLMLGGAASASPSPPEAAPTSSAAAPAPVVLPAASRPAATAGSTALTPRAGQPLRIGVFGDSMGEGLYTVLYRELADAPGVTVTRFSEVSTGLSRYDYVDVQAKTHRQIDGQAIDAAVIMFGTNDAQGISLNGQVHAFGSDGWKAAYGQRIEDLVTLLRQRGIAVYWVGMPRMRSGGFDGKMALVNEVASARLAALGVPWLDTVPLTTDADGAYAAYLPDARGRRSAMRAGDGIHMSMSGYERIGRPMAERIRRDAGLTEAGE